LEDLDPDFLQLYEQRLREEIADLVEEGEDIPSKIPKLTIKGFDLKDDLKLAQLESDPGSDFGKTGRRSQQGCFKETPQDLLSRLNQKFNRTTIKGFKPEKNYNQTASSFFKQGNAGGLTLS
jgi:hypothetical protein